MKYATAAAALLLACLVAASGPASAQEDVEAQHFGRPYKPPGNNGGSIATNVFVASLGGSSRARANAQLVVAVNTAARTAQYKLTINNVNDYISSHIHLVSLSALEQGSGGRPDVAGPVVVLLLPGLGSSGALNSTDITGLADLPEIAPIDICTLTYSSTITADDFIEFEDVSFDWDLFLSNLRTGTLYVNIHTRQAPAGLIRGQLYPARSSKYGYDVSCPARFGRKSSQP
ncbi:hypothetical protein COO60DRAFT_1507370 [Scenedesmus sp. NREL 46B-D3]|nr:hypothetical protein COO60DRAFT_1507370 [Scenedesmus sp. NREL 46B-D3]